ERLFRVYVAGAGCNLEVTVRHFPRGGAAVFAGPTGKILSVEQHHRVRWRCSNAMLSARSARRHLRWQRARAVAGLPLDHRHGNGGERGHRAKRQSWNDKMTSLHFVENSIRGEPSYFGAATNGRLRWK